MTDRPQLHMWRGLGRLGLPPRLQREARAAEQLRACDHSLGPLGIEEHVLLHVLDLVAALADHRGQAGLVEFPQLLACEDALVLIPEKVESLVESVTTVTSHKLQVTSRKLQVASCKLQVTSCKSQVTSRKLQVANHKLQVTSYKLQVASCKLQVTSYKLRVTSY